MSAIDDLAAERKRQIEGERFGAEHDDRHTNSELAAAAACYAVARDSGRLGPMSGWWPWEPEWWKPKSRRQNLVKAGALIIAEIERLDRATAKAAA